MEKGEGQEGDRRRGKGEGRGGGGTQREPGVCSLSLSSGLRVQTPPASQGCCKAG